MAQSKKSKAPDAACRINFMYQAAHALLLKQSLSIKDPRELRHILSIYKLANF